MKKIYLILITVFIVLSIILGLKFYNAYNYEKSLNDKLENRQLLQANNFLNDKGMIEVGNAERNEYPDLTITLNNGDSSCEGAISNVVQKFNGTITISNSINKNERVKINSIENDKDANKNSKNPILIIFWVLMFGILIGAAHGPILPDSTGSTPYGRHPLVTRTRNTCARSWSECVHREAAERRATGRIASSANEARCVLGPRDSVRSSSSGH